jgi:hypothetical protein
MRLYGGKLIVACAVAGLFVVILELVNKSGAGGAFLLALSFWVSIAQGCVALVAGAELSNAKWIIPVRNRLLRIHPLLLFFSLLFLFLWAKMEMYPWSPATSVWLGKEFFIVRNFVMLLLSFFLARKLSAECFIDGAKKHFYAVLYLLAFVISQSLIAFDWVMSLEYPWFSTLLGGYFFIEAFYGGIAIAVFICIFEAAASTDGEKTMRDAAKMMFGFSLLWAGLFYAQYLVIWYGNLPEELSYLLKRISPPYFILSRLILALMFIVPFIVLLSKRVKSNRTVMFFLSLCILVGIFLERVLFIMPAVNTSLTVAAVDFLLLGILFFATLSSDAGRRANP